MTAIKGKGEERYRVRGISVSKTQSWPAILPPPSAYDSPLPSGYGSSSLAWCSDPFAASPGLAHGGAP